MCLIGECFQFWPGVCMLPACIWPIILVPKTCWWWGGGVGRGRLAHLCRETIIQYWLATAWLFGEGDFDLCHAKSQTLLYLLYHVKYLLAYLNITSSLLGKKVVMTESVTGVSCTQSCTYFSCRNPCPTCSQIILI